jgi:hypothetical protein
VASSINTTRHPGRRLWNRVRVHAITRKKEGLRYVSINKPLTEEDEPIKKDFDKFSDEEKQKLIEHHGKHRTALKVVQAL